MKRLQLLNALGARKPLLQLNCLGGDPILCLQGLKLSKGNGVLPGHWGQCSRGCSSHKKCRWEGLWWKSTDFSLSEVLVSTRALTHVKQCDPWEPSEHRKWPGTQGQMNFRYKRRPPGPEKICVQQTHPRNVFTEPWARRDERKHLGHTANTYYFAIYCLYLYA